MMVCARTVPQVVGLATISLYFGCGFYLPGVAPKEYADGAEVQIKVNKLTSAKSLIPYRYYYLPFCQPKQIQGKVENLGEILAGDAIENSPYRVRMRQNVTCQLLCQKNLQEVDKESYRKMIDKEYSINWIVDNLPAATRYIREDNKEMLYNGFPIGGLDQQGRYYLFNHVTLELKYHQRPDAYEGSRIVGFEVIPSSISQTVRENLDSPDEIDAFCGNDFGTQRFLLSQHNKAIFTYDVQWRYSDKRWASRWDNYLEMKDGSQVHWFSLISAALMMLCMSWIVAIILLRTLYRDIVKYNELATEEEAQEESGWKLVHGDVFRPPKWPMLLAATLGCGVQVIGMSAVTLVFAVCGFLSPANRGSLLQSMMLVFTLLGTVAGYVAARVYKLFDGVEWKQLSFVTGLLYPGIVFGIFFLLNLILWGRQSSGAVPFATMFVLLALWFGISLPLVFVGAYLGMRRDPIELPVRISKIERLIPEQPLSMNPWVTAAIGGILPFSAVFAEFFFIMSSIWMHQFYYLFGFLALTLHILIIICIEVSISLVYFQLTAENHNWWWRSFFNTGATGVYLFLYSGLYFNTRLEIASLVSTLMYFGYMLIMSLLFSLITGSIGTFSAFLFTKAIYASIKID